MATILGIIMMYSWVHSVVILAKNEKRTKYEETVLIVALVGFILFVIGSLS